MIHFDTLKAYCSGINIPPPKWDQFDVRSFQENMKTVHHTMSPFKHEFYAIALKLDGTGYAKTGNHSTENHNSTIFFNSPYQINQWDIAPNWEGYYLMFTEDFYRKLNFSHQIGQEFPFLMIDNNVPLALSADDTPTFIKTFEEVKKEYGKEDELSRKIIWHHTYVLLYKVARLFKEQSSSDDLSYTQRNTDLALVSRFKTLIETSFYPDQRFENSEPHKVQYYAETLAVHPNHLNALSKRITNHSASELIYQHILGLAKSKLQNTGASVKEIAFELYYNYPNHFTKFFKKQTGMTPGAFRK